MSSEMDSQHVSDNRLSGVAWVVIVVALLAIVAIAIATFDANSGQESISEPYAPYTYSETDEPYAPYTAGPVVRETPYEAYTEEPYAPYTAGPVVREEEPYAPYPLPR